MASSDFETYLSLKNEEEKQSYLNQQAKDKEERDKTPYEKYGNLPLFKLDTMTMKSGKYRDVPFVELFHKISYVEWVLKSIVISKEETKMNGMLASPLQLKGISECSYIYLFRMYVLRKIAERTQVQK